MNFREKLLYTAFGVNMTFSATCPRTPVSPSLCLGF